MTKAQVKLQDPKSSPQARGKRLRSLRMMTSLSRKEVYEKFDLSSSTQQSWEDAKAGGLTEKGARRAIEVFRKAGVRCSLNWLLYGIGEPPQLMGFEQAEGSGEQADGESLGEDKAIIRELLTFRECHPDAVDLQLADDGMAPFYQVGDYVAGKRYYGYDISRLAGQDCIVETANNDILLRRLRLGSKDNSYTLICMNPDTEVQDYALNNQVLLSAAPVIWHRRKVD